MRDQAKLTKINQTFAIVKEIISDTTGTDIDEIFYDSMFEDDLGISIFNELPKIITAINAKLKLELKHKIIKDEELETVKDLVLLVMDETELG